MKRIGNLLAATAFALLIFHERKAADVVCLIAIGWISREILEQILRIRARRRQRTEDA